MVPPGRYVLGWDVAGTVDRVGPGDVGLTPGDPVIGLTHWLSTRVGTQAEYAVLDAATLAPSPVGLTAAEASTVPSNALTADQALDLLALTAGQTLAITGAGGGVGGYAVELARDRGITVLGVGSDQDREFLDRPHRDLRAADREPGRRGASRGTVRCGWPARRGQPGPGGHRRRARWRDVRRRDAAGDTAPGNATSE